MALQAAQQKGTIMTSIAPYWKAFVGFVTPGAVLIGAAVTDGSQGGSRITTSEWVTAAVACFVTSAAVYAVPNKDPQGLHQEESVQPSDDHTGKHEAGAVDVVLILLVAILLGVALLLFGVSFR